MSALLEVERLSVRFPVRGASLFARSRGTVRAVDDVSFAIRRGEALGLVGESGSGKSTIARAIVGLARASAGSIRLEGNELTGLSRRGWLPHRRRIQMVFQDPLGSLDPRQSVLAIVEEPMTIHALGNRRERRERAFALLDAVGLSARFALRYPHELSGGQRQRVGIARALALEPELLVCDEPVSALDVSVQAQIVNLLRDLRERFDLALLFIAHDLAVVRTLCERVAVLYHGRVVEIAPRDELFGAPRHPYTRALLAAVPLPDPAIERATHRRALQGEPPSPLVEIAGCAFHPRCAERTDAVRARCERERPALRRGGGDGEAACHLREV